MIWQLPAILKAIPSRYVAAYLPAPLQALAERDHDEILPAAAASVNAEHLLAPDSPSASTLDTKPTVDVVITTPQSTDNQSGNPGLMPSHQPTSKSQPPTNTPSPTLEPIPAAYRLNSFRHQFQTWNNCGPATLAMSLSFFDIYLSQEETASVLKPNPEDRNVNPWEMAAYVKDQTEIEAIFRTNGNLEKLRHLLANDIPVIVELGIDPPGDYRWMGWYGHYLLLVAYDDSLKQVWVYDSWFGTSEVPAENADADGRQISYEELDRYWRQFNRNYIALYETEKADIVGKIIGEDINDDMMWQKSLASARAETSANPDNAFLWFNLGNVYNALGEYVDAALAFDQARAIGLPWRMLWYQFGPYEAYYQVGRYDDVLLLTESTLKDRPYFEESYYYRGLALAALGDTAEARTNLEKALRFNPNFSAAAIALAQIEAGAALDSLPAISEMINDL